MQGVRKPAAITLVLLITRKPMNKLNRPYKTTYYKIYKSKQSKTLSGFKNTFHSHKNQNIGHICFTS